MSVRPVDLLEAVIFAVFMIYMFYRPVIHVAHGRSFLRTVGRVWGLMVLLYFIFLLTESLKFYLGYEFGPYGGNAGPALGAALITGWMYGVFVYIVGKVFGPLIRRLQRTKAQPED